MSKRHWSLADGRLIAVGLYLCLMIGVGIALVVTHRG